MLRRIGWGAAIGFLCRCGLFVVCTLHATGFAEAAKPNEVRGQAQVIDGDSLQIGYERIRLVGIDAPEGRQTCEREGVTWLCGQEAAKVLRSVVDGQEVRCTPKRPATATAAPWRAARPAGGRDIGEELVGQGMALAFRRYSTT